MDHPEEPKYQRCSQSSRLTPFHEAPVQVLSVDARRAKKESTARMLFQDIKASRYDTAIRGQPISFVSGGKAKATQFQIHVRCE
jgi:hypothetical protein